MRNLTIQFPSTNGLTDSATQEYAKLLNIELDNFKRDLNRYVSRIVVKSCTEDATLTASDELIIASGTITVTLPDVSSSEGKMFTIKNVGVGTVTVSGTIDGSDPHLLSSQYDFVIVVSDGTEWFIIGE